MCLVNDLIASFGAKLRENLQLVVSGHSVVDRQFIEVYLGYLFIFYKMYTIFTWADERLGK